MHSKYYIPARSATLPYTVDVTPESAGWTEASLSVVELQSKQELSLDTNDIEVMILPLAGGGTVECDNETFELSPRASVFDGPADMVYIGTGQSYTLRGEGRIRDLRRPRHAAVPQPQGGGRRRGRRAARHRQLQPPGAQLRHRRRFRRRLADRVRGDHPRRQLVELPGAQARRRDTASSRRSRRSTTSRSPQAQTIPAASATTASTARRAGPIEVLEEVRSGDVVLVPHGYHGPSVAAPGYHMYYLNVMAGPGEERAWKIVDDPEHAWLRGTWEDQAVDPRLPLHTRGV